VVEIPHGGFPAICWSSLGWLAALLLAVCTPGGSLLQQKHQDRTSTATTRRPKPCNEQNLTELGSCQPLCPALACNLVQRQMHLVLLAGLACTRSSSGTTFWPPRLLVGFLLLINYGLWPSVPVLTNVKLLYFLTCCVSRFSRVIHPALATCPAKRAGHRFAERSAARSAAR
jgi:hypothetical protein